jgi:hypothetical protein
MELKILLKDVEYKELLSANEHINNGYFEPHYRSCVGDIEYEYEVEPTTDDYVDYFIEKADTKIIEKTEDKEVLKRMFDDDYFKNWFENALDDLRWDDDFEAFMKERYYDKALEEYERNR